MTPAQLAVVSVTPDDSEELHMKPDVAAAILRSQQQTVDHIEEQIVDDVDYEADADDDGQCWYEVVERLPASNSTLGPLASESNEGEQVIALFPTKKEALECVRIKKSFGKKRGEDGSDGRFFVQRRWNV